MKNIEIISHKKEIFATIIRKKSIQKKGVNFFTKNNDLIQVGFIKHKRKHLINSYPY